MPDLVKLVDKPAGVTSHDLVAAERRRQGDRSVRVGHAGTLDPFATGLLIVLVGRAARVQQYVMGLDKTYETLARLGWTSSTGDPEGELVDTGRVPALDGPLPTGVIRQRPPAYSALRVDGVRAYPRARRGEDVRIPEREVRVDRYEVLDHDPGAGTARLAVACSSGTYVRTLVSDLGDAYCLQLRRTSIGPFGLDEAPAELSLAAALGRLMPVIELEGERAWRVSVGQRIPLELAGERALLVDGDGPIAVAEPREDGMVKPVVGFR